MADTIEPMFNNTDIVNSTNGSEQPAYHIDYISCLIITMLAFFLVSYYLYYIAKQGANKAKSAGVETAVLHYKYEIIRSLAIANASI
jgi:hypothetical protein